MTEQQALRRMIDERGIGLKLALLLTASRDRRLTGRSLNVYAALVGDLAFDAFQPVKHAALARHVHLHRNRVGVAVALLERLGYLKRDGEALDGRLSRYCLPTASPIRQDRPAA